MSLGQCGLIVEGPKIAGHLVVTAWLFENVSKLALAGLLGAVMMITRLPWLYSSYDHEHEHEHGHIHAHIHEHVHAHNHIHEHTHEDIQEHEHEHDHEHIQ